MPRLVPNHEARQEGRGAEVVPWGGRTRLTSRKDLGDWSPESEIASLSYYPDLKKFSGGACRNGGPLGVKPKLR